MLQPRKIKTSNVNSSINGLLKDETSDNAINRLGLALKGKIARYQKGVQDNSQGGKGAWGDRIYYEDGSFENISKEGMRHAVQTPQWQEFQNRQVMVNDTLPLVNTVAFNTQFALGGMSTSKNNSYALGGDITRFDTGGTHEQNPNGGIPLGEGASVEQGETKMNTPDGQFIFSDRIQITPNVANTLNLPKSWIGKTMSDYSKKIDSQFKDRDDNISRSTKKRMLDRGAEVQEAIKKEQEALINAQNANALQGPEDMMNGQVPQGAEQFMDQSQMAFGGYRKQMFAGGVPEDVKPSVITNEGQIEANKLKTDQFNSKMQNYANAYNTIAPTFANALNTTGNDSKRSQDIQTVNALGTGIGSAIGGSAGSTVSSAVTGATGLYDMGKEAFGRSNIDTSGQQSISGANAGKSAGAGALKGAGTGAAIGSIIPGVGTLIGAGVGAVVGGVTGLIGGKKDEKAQLRNNNNYARKFNQQFSDSYALGGYVNPLLNEYIDSAELRTASQQNAQYKKGGLVEAVNTITPTGLTQPSVFDPTTIKSSANVLSQGNVNPSFWQKLKYGIDEQGNSNGVFEGLSQASDKLGNAMRYSPIAMDAYQLSKLKKPKGERLDRLSNRFTPTYVDLANQQNIANQELNNVTSAIQGSGASQGAMRATLLGAQLNKSKGLSQAYMDAEARNAQQNALAQQFNLGVDSTNLNQSNSEADINARNLGNYETQKSKLLSNIGTTAGEIGREEYYKDITGKMTGYDSKGRYILTPSGEKQYVSTDKKKLGGVLIRKK